MRHECRRRLYPCYLITMADLSDHPLMLLIRDIHYGKEQTKAFRIKRFCVFQESTDQKWCKPDLSEYRDYLLLHEQLSPESVRSYLSTIRNAYRELISAPQYQHIFSTRQLRNQLITALHPSVAPVVTHLGTQLGRILSRETMELLLAAPGTYTSNGIRDTSIIALMLCTGISAFELVSLDVTDLVVESPGRISIWIKNSKPSGLHRIIPSEPFTWGIDLTKQWIMSSGILAGPIYPANPDVTLAQDKFFAPERLHSSAISNMLSRYSIRVSRETGVIRPRDLRRTYAHGLYSTGVAVEEIQRRLGCQSLMQVKLMLNLESAN
jgi:integrase